MSAPPQPYKRSWKNLLLNKRYQLRFTLFMVGLSAILIVGLGFWVLRVAEETTEVSNTTVCTPVPAITATPAAAATPPAEPAPSLDEATPTERAPAAGSADAGSADAGSADAGSADAGSADVGSADAGSADAGSADEGSADAPEGGERRVVVQMQESEIEMVQVPPDFGTRVLGHWTCQMRINGQRYQLELGRLRFLVVLIATGLLLVLGLAAYGIKMTHKVAGPLFKVTLYFNKMRDGRFDKVWNLRKGDQLVEFYEHFKTAHAGVVKMEKDDIARIAAVIEAAEAAGLGEHASVTELRELLARKEKAVE